MWGHAAIAEVALADVGGVLQVATAEMNALASSSSIGSGTLVGVSSLSGNFTQTSTGILITGGVNAEVSSSFTQTTEDIKIVSFNWLLVETRVCESKMENDIAIWRIKYLLFIYVFNNLFKKLDDLY